MKKEIRSLTGLRGIAAIYVTIYHWYLLHIYMFGNNHLPLQEFIKIPVQQFIKHGYISVDMFFILSGFVITLSSEKTFGTDISLQSYFTFMKRRFARIYPVYFIITLVGFAMLMRMHDFKSLVLNLLLVQVITPANYVLGQSWSLSAEWFAYLLFPLFFIAVFRKKHTLWHIGCICLSFCGLWFISQHYLPEVNMGPLDHYRGVLCLIRCFSEYIAGITLFKIYTTFKDSHGQMYHWLTIPVVLIILGLLCLPKTDILIVFLFTVLIFSLSTDKGIIAGILSSKGVYLSGECSYSLYLIHPIILRTQFTLYKFLNKHYVAHNYILSCIYLTVALILLSFLTHRYIEIPSREYIRKKVAI